MEKLNILVIPDAHAKPGVGNERFTWAGKFAADRQPDIIISIGDFADMPSLSSYDVGKKSFEGKRFSLDLKATHDALSKFQKPIDDLNDKLKSKKIKQYHPDQYITLGNHENRVNRVIDNDPKLDGTISIDDLGYQDFGWNVIPFLHPLDINGIVFQHYMVSGNMGRAISSVNIGRALLKKTHGSCFVGHSHLLDLAWEANSQGQLMMAGSVGCFFSHLEDYLPKQAQSNWWRGLVLLKGVHDGLVDDFETISMDTLKDLYS